MSYFTYIHEDSSGRIIDVVNYVETFKALTLSKKKFQRNVLFGVTFVQSDRSTYIASIISCWLKNHIPNVSLHNEYYKYISGNFILSKI